MLISRDGSSTGTLFVPTVSVQTDRGRTTLTFGANAVERIARVLMGRLPYGRGLLVDGPEMAVGFLPGDRLAIADRGNGMTEIKLPSAVLTELVAVLRPVAGRYDLPGTTELAVLIVKSQIRRPDGALITEIG